MIITIKIDGAEYEVKEGENILSICQKLGIFVPHLCYLKDFSSSGKCGLCLVEVNDERLELSCLLVAKSDLRITTFNEKIQIARKKRIDRLLKNHNISCHSCSKNGWCSFQNMTAEIYRHEKTIENFNGCSKIKSAPIKINNDIVYDRSKCLFCNRCIKFLNESCDEKLQSPADLQNVRGNDLLGNVVDLCPTAALNQNNLDSRNSLIDSEELETFDISNVFTPKIKTHINNGNIIKVSMDQHWICDDLRFVYNKPKPQKFSNDLYFATVQNIANKIKEKNNEKCIFAIGENVDIVSFFYIKYLSQYNPNILISFDDHNVPTTAILETLKNFESLLLADYFVILKSEDFSEELNLLSNIKNLKEKITIKPEDLPSFFEQNKSSNKNFLYSRPAIVLYKNSFETDPDILKKVEQFAKIYQEVYNFPLKTFVIPHNVSNIYSKFLSEYVPLSELFKRFNKHDLRFILQIGEMKNIQHDKEILYVKNSVSNDGGDCIHIPALHFLEDSAFYLNLFGKIIKTNGKSNRKAISHRRFMFDIMQSVFGKDFYDVNEEILDEIRRLK